MKFTEARQKIDNLIKEKYPKFYTDPEYNAAITHWMHNPKFQYPYITDEIFQDLYQLFQK